MIRKILHMLGRPRLWSRLGRRHFLWPAAIGIALAVGYNAALPLVISTTDVRPTMERMLDAWSGGKSRITGEPDIRFWPNPTLTLYGATIETTDGTPRTLARIGSITASFSLLSALRGEPALEDIRLIEPVVTLERGADGTLNWSGRAGLRRADLPLPTPTPPSATSRSRMAACRCLTGRPIMRANFPAYPAP